MSRWLLPLLLTLGVLALRWGGREPDVAVLLDPYEPRPGQTVELTLKGLPRGYRASAKAGELALPLYRSSDGSLRALVPIPGDAQGLYSVELELRGLGAWTRKLALKLEPVDFPKQELKLAAEKTELFTKPETADATVLIRRTLKTESPERLWRGPFAEPLEGRVSTVYGAQRTLNGSIQYFHKGIDVAVPSGSEVRSANRGVVELAGAFPLQGNLVVVDHGQGVKSAYQHLEAILVRQGQELPKGAVVGRAGATGLASGPHLHWSVYVHGIAVDPEDWVRRGF